MHIRKKSIVVTGDPSDPRGVKTSPEQAFCMIKLGSPVGSPAGDPSRMLDSDQRKDRYVRVTLVAYT